MKMKKMNITKKMYDTGALAIVRAETIERACEIADGCIEGKIPVMEMSYTLNNAGDIIQQLTKKYGEQLCVGAGTVLDAQTARHAILHGAQFIIAPNYNEEVAEMCRAVDVPVIMEGHVYDPESAMKSLYLGCYAVVVGSAITRPHFIVKRFTDLLNKFPKDSNWRDDERAWQGPITKLEK